MNVRPKALIAWSSGKDSAWALHETRRSGDCEIVGALTTVTETFGRVSMHGVREDILAAQLQAAGLPLVRVLIPFPARTRSMRRAWPRRSRTRRLPALRA
jgi:diphthamide synthase (EF-2-diphthine--ammonia ligase)